MFTCIVSKFFLSHKVGKDQILKQHIRKTSAVIKQRMKLGLIFDPFKSNYMYTNFMVPQLKDTPYAIC